MLGRGGDARAIGAIRIECGLLMRVFPIAKGLCESAAKGPATRGFLELLRHPSTDRSVICRGAGICGLRQTLPQRIVGLAVIFL